MDIEFFTEDVLIAFNVFKEEIFPRDLLIVNDSSYYISIYIEHTLEHQPLLNKIILDLMKKFPKTLVCDEACKEFYSLHDVQQGKLKKWIWQG